MRRRSLSSSARPRLRRVRRGERLELWTETVGSPPSVYGERWAEFEGRRFRAFEPSRSKLAAALVHDWSGDVPRPGERWLYLGAASGSTASHVADLVAESGRVYAIEKSLRPFARLYQLSDRWPNLLPILADARSAEEYADLVPPVDGIYADIAQPDQVEITLGNAALYLRDERSVVLIALKTPSMGRERPATAYRTESEELLHPYVDLEPSVRLDPFHRGHYLLGGRARSPLFHLEGPLPITPRRGRSPAPRRP